MSNINCQKNSRNYRGENKRGRSAVGHKSNNRRAAEVRTLIISVLFVTAVCSLLTTFTIRSRAAEEDSVSYKYYTSYVVSDNDTLWSIAEANMCDEYNSIDEYINEVKAINNLGSDTIHYGENLVIPYYSSQANL